MLTNLINKNILEIINVGSNKRVKSFYGYLYKTNLLPFGSFECGKTECIVCKPIRIPKQIWDKISKRPRLIHLPEPIYIER